MAYAENFNALFTQVQQAGGVLKIKRDNRTIVYTTDGKSLYKHELKNK